MIKSLFVKQSTCPYCRVNNKKPIATKPFSVVVRPGSKQMQITSVWGGHVDSFPIKYCPMCGKSLADFITEDQKGESNARFKNNKGNCAKHT